MKDINVINDNNKIDLDSLNKFLLKNGDEYLLYLLLNKELVDDSGLNEGIIRKYILNNYKPSKLFLKHIEKDYQLISYIVLLLYFEEEKNNTALRGYGGYGYDDEKTPNTTIKLLELNKYNNKYFSIDNILNYNILFVKFIPDDLLTQEICDNLYKRNYRVIRELPNKFKTYKMCYNAINTNCYLFSYLPEPSEANSQITPEQCYSLLVKAYDDYVNISKYGADTFWRDATINSKIDREYFIRLMYEFNAQEYVNKYGQAGRKYPKNNSLQESKSLLKEEEFFNVEQLEYDSDKHKLDIEGLSEFLYNNGDDYLEYLLADKEYIKVDSKNVFRLYKNKNFKDVTEFLNIGYDFLNVILTDPIEKNKIEQFYLKNRYPHDYPDILWESRAFCEAALIKQKTCLYKVPLKFRDYKMCKLAVSFDGNNIKSVPENIENYYSLCEMAVSQRAWSLMLIDKNKWDYNLCEKAVSQNGGVLFYIPEKYRDYNLCEKAVSSEPSSIYDVPENIENYYSLLKLAYSKDKTVILDMNLPKEYFDKLENDFAEIDYKKTNDKFNREYNFYKELYLKQKSIINSSIIPPHYVLQLRKEFPEDSYLINPKSLNENKSLLKEGITDEVYHFTNISNLVKIMASNTFNLSMNSNEVDRTYNKDNKVYKYDYYMSLSRTGSFKQGYVNFMINNEVYDKNFIVRFKLDGRKLSQKYTGQPINFYNIYNKSYKFFEYEDRLLSNKSYIKPFSNYVIGIDVLVLKNSKENIQVLTELMRLYSNWNNLYNIKINFINKEIPKQVSVIQENKSLLKEGITDEVYHFTNLSNIYKILDTNTFQLGNLMDDNYIKDKYFYMSLSRTKSFYTGFSQVGKSPNVRITLDGRKLSQRFKGGPYNDEVYSKKYPVNDYTFKSDSFEYEDRLYSKNRSIPNFSYYVKQIDILNVDLETDLVNDIITLCKERNILLNFINLNEKSLINKISNGQITISSVPDNIKTMSFYKKLIEDDYYNFFRIVSSDKNITSDNYYELLKLAYKVNDNLINNIETIRSYNSLIDKEQFNKLKTDVIQESKSLLKEDDYTEEEELLEEISDKHKLDINSLNKFLIENNDTLLEYLLFDNNLLDVEKNIMNIVKNKHTKNFGNIPVKYLYQPNVIKQIILRNPELLEKLSRIYLESMDFNNQEMKDAYKYALINKPHLLHKIPTELPYYNELLEAMFQKDRSKLFDLLTIQPKSINQAAMLSIVIKFLENKGYSLIKNNSLQESKQPFKRKILLD